MKKLQIAILLLSSLTAFAADSKITAFDEVAVPAMDDVVPIADISDTTQAASGTTKKVKLGLAKDMVGLGEVTVASATTTDLGAVASPRVSVTGTTTITSFGTATVGTTREGRFTGALTLTHNGTSLILPGSANITTATGDRFRAYSLGSGNWLVTHYSKAAARTVTKRIPINFKGGGAEIPDGLTGYIPIPDAWTVIGYAIEADQTGSIEFFVRNETDPYDGSGNTDNRPNSGDNVITSGAPALSSGVGKLSTDVSGWTANNGTSWASGSMSAVGITSCTTIQEATIWIYYRMVEL